MENKENTKEDGINNFSVAKNINDENSVEIELYHWIRTRSKELQIVIISVAFAIFLTNL